MARKLSRPVRPRQNLRCPVCNGPAPAQDAPFRPFCSDRCKLQDLGKWVSGRYVIPGAPVDGEGYAGEEGAPDREDDDPAEA